MNPGVARRVCLVDLGTYEPAPADSDGNGAPAATGSESSDGTKSKPQEYKMFCRHCRASYSVTALMRLPDRGLFRKYSKGLFFSPGPTTF